MGHLSKVNWTRPLILVGILLVIWPATCWYEFKQKPKQEEARQREKKFFPIKEATVQSFALTNGKSHVLIRCLDVENKLCKPSDNSKWELKEPLQMRADDANSNALLSALNHLEFSESIDLNDENPEKRAALLKEYGLDPASLTSSGARRIEVKTTSGEYALHLGLTHPMGDSIFAASEKTKPGQALTGKIDEKQIYLIPNYFKSNLERELTYWRDKKMVTITASEIESFKLAGGKANLSADRKDGQWTLHLGSEGRPDDVAGDIENVDNLLNGVAYLTAKDFAADQKSSPAGKAALQGTRNLITLTLQPAQGKPPIVLTFHEKGASAASKSKNGGTPPGVPATGKLLATASNLDPVFELEPNAKDRFDKSVKDLRLTKLITSMERFSAKRIELAGNPIGATPLVLNNKEGKWSATDPTYDVSQEKVQSLLDKLSGNRIKDYLQGKDIPTGEKEGLRITLGDEKTETKRQIIFWKAGDKIYARDLQSKRKEALLVDPTLKDGLPWSRDSLKNTEKKK